ncbi:MAG: hypothetical protein HOL16_08295 [Alphaproteobacteria bacterium]|jgi:hypothetical protein|nr:hypothetical protein [Alphaproteobacteria bacterium]
MSDQEIIQGEIIEKEDMYFVVINIVNGPVKSPGKVPQKSPPKRGGRRGLNQTA